MVNSPLPHRFHQLCSRLFGKLALLLGSLLIASQSYSKQVDVHDPVMAKEKDRYYLYSTGPGITFYSSSDLKTAFVEIGDKIEIDTRTDEYKNRVK